MLVNPSGWNSIVERAHHALIVGQQPDQELLGGALHEIERHRHAAARVEHDDDGDRLRLVVEQVDRLQLAVVVPLEVVFREIGNEAFFRIGDRRVKRHRPRRDPDRSL